jgi:hypothetical protein
LGGETVKGRGDQFRNTGDIFATGENPGTSVDDSTDSEG